MNKITSAISGFDMFTSLPTLRMKGDPQVSNVCGGFFSMIVFGFFTYVFISNVVGTINLQNISSKESIQLNTTYEPINNIKLAVGLQGMNLTQLRSFFQLRAFISQAGKPYVPVSILPCTRQMWSQLDDTRYNTLNLQYHMCLKSDQIQIYGENGTPNLTALYFNLSVCSNLTSPVPCAPQAVIDYFFANYMIFGRYLACSFAILDVGFNPTNQNPITYTVNQKTLWLIFNRNQYIMAQTFIGTYHITTDVSFLPVNSQVDQYGYFVVDSLVLSVSNQNSSLLLVQSFLFSTAINKVMDRQFGKIDDDLSYVGGLFGIIISFFGFFLLSFNQYKYQLRVSEGAFSTENNHLSKESDFHFFKYLKYSLFDWIKTLCRCEPKWEDCIAIEEARQQANQQIDVKHLLQRISHIQMVMKSQNFDKQGDTAMYMVKHNPIQEAKQRRIILQYCNKFNDQIAGLTINTIENINAVISFSGLNKLQTSQILFKPKATFPKNTIQMQNLNEKSSIQIIAEHIENYNQKLQQFFKNIQLQQEDKKAEQELMISFYSLSEERRLKIVKNIPIGILYRISKLYQQKNGNLGNKNNKQVNLNSMSLTQNFQNNKATFKNSFIQYKE